MTPKAQMTKDKIDKLDLKASLHVCASEDTVKKIKGQLTGQKYLQITYLRRV